MADGGEVERWARLQGHFEALVDLAEDDRGAYLDREVPDTEMRSELRGLLTSHEREGGLDRLSSALTTLAEGTDGDPAPEPTPERIGPYAIEREIGAGGMGSVYLAHRQGSGDAEDAGTDAPVALKLLRTDADSERLRRRFLVEREILRGLVHRNIAGFVDDGLSDDGRPYVALEYVEGEPIDRYCDERRLPVGDRIALVRQVCDAVHYAHGLGVVHRDLKPDNVWVTADGTVRLLDFGIAKVLEGMAFGRMHHETTAGVHLLTLDYGSPEQILGQEITPASDVYQLGLLLYRLLVGRTPPAAHRVGGSAPIGDTSVSIAAPSSLLAPDRAGADPAARSGTSAEEIAQARGTDPEALRAILAVGLDDIVLTALAREPADRYRSARALSRDLERYAQGKAVGSGRGLASVTGVRLVGAIVLAAIAAAVALLLTLG